MVVANPRHSDTIAQLFWIDDEGPVAGVVLTDWGREWGCDLIVVPAVSTVPLPAVWSRAVEAIDALGLEAVEVLVRDDDFELQGLLASAGFVADDGRSGITWMDADDRPDVAALPEGFALVDRARDTTKPHPMRRRSGERVEARSGSARSTTRHSTSPSRPTTARPRVTRSSGFDPVTEVGLVEPMRVEDAYQRRGLARAMLTGGLDRLARRGARRLKVGYGTDAARALYLGAGFRVTSTSTLYLRRNPSAAD